MWAWWRKRKPQTPSVPVEERIRRKYSSFRDLTTFNNESLELMAGLQEDLQYIPPRRDILEARVGAIFDKVRGVVSSIESLTALRQPVLANAVEEQRQEVERYTAGLQELAALRLAAWLSEVCAPDADEVGGKASALGEIRNKLGAPVPNGYILTTEAYRLFCGIPLWTQIRDAVRDLDHHDHEAVLRVSEHLTNLVLNCPVPRALEVAITERAATLLKKARGLAVRSSAVGEGGTRTYAGQFTSLLNVGAGNLVDAYKRVVAGRFSERAIFYRISTGLMEVDTPMAVLVLPMIEAAAAGIMYTRDPNDPKSNTLWITSTPGFGVDIASGRTAADLFVVSRSRPHGVVEHSIAHKESIIDTDAAGGMRRVPLAAERADAPSLTPPQIEQLAMLGVRIEDHFRTPQDIEWVLDVQGEFWIVQTRPLTLTESAPVQARAKVREEPRLAGGRTVYPGRAAGKAYLCEDARECLHAPAGAVVFVRRPSPEMVEIFPRIAGFVAEWGNVTGHAAALLREFRVPSVFQMAGVFEEIKNREPVSLDAVQARVYGGALWAQSKVGHTLISERARDRSDPISQRLLALNLLDPAEKNFRPAGCKSAHDVLRYCHERAIETMFAVGDIAMEQEACGSRHLATTLPLNILVLDLGGGLRMEDPETREVAPAEIVSRPFQMLWRGLTHPGVSWTRDMPASLGDIVSVLSRSLTPQSGAYRALGEKSYLLVAGEYMNLNSRLAYHFSLVDACLSDTPAQNYISFRFEGGGTTRQRKNLRAAFIEACLEHYGFHTDRRGDLIRAWFRKAPTGQTEDKLDILGRLLACSGQLDMYMESVEVMRWYVKQFLDGNYSLHGPETQPAPEPQA